MLDIRFKPNENAIQMAVGGVVSLRYVHNRGDSYSPMEIIVSNTFIKHHFAEPQMLLLEIDVDRDYNESIYNALDEQIDPAEIDMISRHEARKSMQDTKMVMLVLGGTFR